jgi:hypothetical protein
VQSKEMLSTFEAFSGRIRKDEKKRFKMAVRKNEIEKVEEIIA